MPPGLTRLGVSWVTAPMTPTLDTVAVGVGQVVDLGLGDLGAQRGGALLVDVRAEVVPRRVGLVGDDPVPQVRPALVELVVAHGRGVQADLVHHIDGRLVVGDRGGEHRGADEVPRAHDARGGQRRAGRVVLQLLDGAGPLDGVGVDAAVEVVDADQVDPDLSVRRLRRAGRTSDDGEARRHKADRCRYARGGDSALSHSSTFRSILSVPSAAYDLLARSRRAARTLGPMVPEGQKFARAGHEMADDPPRVRGPGRRVCGCCGATW